MKMQAMKNSNINKTVFICPSLLKFGDKEKRTTCSYSAAIFFIAQFELHVGITEAIVIH